MRTNWLNSAKWIWRFTRAYEWWHYKIPLALAIAYSYAWMGHISFSKLIVPSVLIVCAGIAAAVWASILDDFMDLDQDRRAGKSTLLMQLAPLRRWFTVAVSLSLFLMVSSMLHRYPSSFYIFVTIGMIFAAYSLPPIRLKERGLLGLICIAAGEHVFPALLALLVVRESSGASLGSVSPIWLCAVLGWSTAYGLRGIIWHQLYDLENDKKAGCKTIGTVIGAGNLERLGHYYVFPMEVFCFIGLLIVSRNSASLVLLPLYALTEWLRRRFISTNMVIVAPKPRPRFIMLEYYQIYLPLSFPAMALPYDRGALFIIPAFAALFPGPIRMLVQQMAHIFEWHVYNRIRGALAKS